MKKHTPNSKVINCKKITRKDAIKKAGLTALTTASLIFLETKPAAANSLAEDLGSSRKSR
jgi:hypothetical protein